MRSRLPADHGAITAEFAVALPAVVGVLALCLGAVSAVSTHTLLTSLAVDSARGWARGDTWAQVQSRVSSQQPRAAVTAFETATDRCVSLSMPFRLGTWIDVGIVIQESACAPVEP